ncbi:MAG: hypothetical protein IJ466_11245 [Clostridia bacterium]|nr:hypothetical protein [Clostridia bacterium]
MEERDNHCNPSDGLVAISVDEFRHLVYEEARSDIVKHLLMAEKSAYIDSNAIRIVMGFKPIVATIPNTPDPLKETPDE